MSPARRMGEDATRGALIPVAGPSGSDQILAAPLAGWLPAGKARRPAPTAAEVAAVARSLLSARLAMVVVLGDPASGADVAEPLASGCRRRRVGYRLFPVDQDGVLGEPFHDGWFAHGGEVRGPFLAGERVGIVSLGFIGAAETLAAQLLVETGTPPPEALDRIDRAVALAASLLPDRRRRLLGLDPWQRGHVLARRALAR